MDPITKEMLRRNHCAVAHEPSIGVAAMEGLKSIRHLVSRPDLSDEELRTRINDVIVRALDHSELPEH